MTNQDTRNVGQQVLQGSKRVHSKTMDFTEFDPTYIGKFVFHHPTIMERAQIGVMKTKMLEGMREVELIADNIIHMIATLHYVLDSTPDWFDPQNMYDYEILDEVYEEYNQWQRTFRRKPQSADNEGNSEQSEQ
jgi:hypothetical protein